MIEADVIIVGQGLAGTLLALELEKLGRSVIIIDDNHRDAASPVAAGLINPVTGMRLSPTAGAAELIPFAISTFRTLEQKFGRSLYRDMDVFRAYENAEEIAMKAKRAADPACARWFGDEISPEAVHPALNAPLGGFMIVGGGRVDLPALLEVAREYFVGSELARVAETNDAPTRASSLPTAKIRLRSEPFAHADLVILPDGAGVRYRDIVAKHIVFAEGAAVKTNPWFGDLAWQPAKGEFITCDMGPDDDLPDCALKIGLSAIPLGGGRRMVGSNYEWNTLDTTPTPAVREALIAGFERMFRHPVKAVVIEHRAGIRPAARGAKPIVGPHSEFPVMHVFNGFGAKGCTWAPTFARDYAARLAK
jgi:glycine oxidase